MGKELVPKPLLNMKNMNSTGRAENTAEKPHLSSSIGYNAGESKLNFSSEATNSPDQVDYHFLSNTQKINKTLFGDDNTNSFLN